MVDMVDMVNILQTYHLAWWLKPKHQGPIWREQLIEPSLLKSRVERQAFKQKLVEPEMNTAPSGAFMGASP